MLLYASLALITSTIGHLSTGKTEDRALRGKPIIKGGDAHRVGAHGLALGGAILSAVHDLGLLTQSQIPPVAATSQ